MIISSRFPTSFPQSPSQLSLVPKDSSTQGEQQALQVIRPHRCRQPCIPSILFTAGHHHSSAWHSSPHDLSHSSASPHVLPSSQSLSFPYIGFLTSRSCLFMLVPPPRSPQSPFLFTFSPSLLSKLYLSLWFSVTPHLLCTPLPFTTSQSHAFRPKGHLPGR